MVVFSLVGDFFRGLALIVNWRSFFFKSFSALSLLVLTTSLTVSRLKLFLTGVGGLVGFLTSYGYGSGFFTGFDSGFFSSLFSSLNISPCRIFNLPRDRSRALASSVLFGCCETKTLFCSSDAFSGAFLAAAVDLASN